MHTHSYAVIVIGAGQAGRSASDYLAQAGVDHRVGKGGQVGESGRSQRWHHVVLNTAHKLNTLPSYGYRSQQPDGFIAQHPLTCPLPEPDPDDQPNPNGIPVSPLTWLHLAQPEVTTVIWATGLGGDFRSVNRPMLDQDGYPNHQPGVTDGPGLYGLRSAMATPKTVDAFVGQTKSLVL